MKSKSKSKLNLILLGATLMAAARGADELADKGGEIFQKSQRAVVTVQAVVKGPDGHNGTRESKQDVTGTVIDPSGLTVIALSSVDATELYRRISEKYKTELEVADIKILLDDGTELPAEIVLRDKDLDLAYVRPKTKPAAPMAAVDLTKSSPLKVLEQVLTLNRLNRAAGRAYSISVERIAAVIQKPRTFYIPDSGQSTTALGSPAFALNGNVVGMFVMRAVNAEESSASNPREYMTAILIPAEDILKGEKQALEAKPEADKPAAAATADKPKEDKK